MADVVCLGEMLVDFVPDRVGVTLAEAERFVKAAGGAPANVAVGVARLGGTSAFIGKVGEDAFGHWLADILETNGVDVGNLVFSKQARTGLAFVSLTDEGDRDFLFFRHPSADQLHAPEDVDLDLVRSAKVLHHGSISLIQEPSRSATEIAIHTAHEAGVTVSYDPNLRLPLWSDANTAREGILRPWRFANVIKVSEEELVFLTGSHGEEAARSLWHEDLALLLVTRGAEGVTWLTASDQGSVPSPRVSVADTTGAGDAFVASLLSSWCERPSLHLAPREELERALARAAAYAALTTTKPGAIPALPARAELESWLEAH